MNPKSAPTARALAHDILMKVEEGAFADRALGQALVASILEPRDKQLVTRLVYGTLASQLRLDHTINAYAAKRSSIDPAVRVVLRLGIYQLTELDRVPDHAAVSTAVDLCKQHAPYAAKFTNAILRRTLRDGPAKAPKSKLDALAVELSHPKWLINRWLKRLGEDETRAFCIANNEPAPNALRALISTEEAIDHLKQNGINADPSSLAPDGLIAGTAVALKGIAVSQSEGSQAVVQALGLTPGNRVLDTCAAPGGKTAYIASIVGANGSVVAVDSAPDAKDRIDHILDLCHRDGHDASVEIVESPILTYQSEDLFDAVLVDAPCTGLGTLAEHPEIRWRRCADDIRSAAKRQQNILKAASPFVRPGGTLLYATCSLEPEETDDVVDAFLESAGDSFSENPLVREQSPTPRCIDDDGRLRTWPHKHQTSGFFAACLKRRAN